MSNLAHWWALLCAKDAPALPSAWVMQLGLSVGWALVLATVGACLGGSLLRRRAAAFALALWSLLPGPLGPDYWLGLAFHAPSLVAMLLCCGVLWRCLSAAPRSWPVARGPTYSVAWLLLPLLLGYALLLDTIALLPVPLYAWGFSPLALLLLLSLALLPWLLPRAPYTRQPRVAWVAPAALLLFAATRLTTGNVWDAVLDPLLWLVLHAMLLARVLRAGRATRF